jgi:hypothetical protein
MIYISFINTLQSLYTACFFIMTHRDFLEDIDKKVFLVMPVKISSPWYGFLRDFMISQSIKIFIIPWSFSALILSGSCFSRLFFFGLNFFPKKKFIISTTLITHNVNQYINDFHCCVYLTGDAIGIRTEDVSSLDPTHGEYSSVVDKINTRAVACNLSYDLTMIERNFSNFIESNKVDVRIKSYSSLSRYVDFMYRVSRHSHAFVDLPSHYAYFVVVALPAYIKSGRVWGLTIEALYEHVLDHLIDKVVINRNTLVIIKPHPSDFDIDFKFLQCRFIDLHLYFSSSPLETLLSHLTSNFEISRIHVVTAQTSLIVCREMFSLQAINADKLLPFI